MEVIQIMESKAVCPYCMVPLVDKGDIPTFNIEVMQYDKQVIDVLSCGKCSKVISINWRRPVGKVSRTF